MGSACYTISRNTIPSKTRPISRLKIGSGSPSTCKKTTTSMTVSSSSMAPIRWLILPQLCPLCSKTWGNQSFSRAHRWVPSLDENYVPINSKLAHPPSPPPPPPGHLTLSLARGGGNLTDHLPTYWKIPYQFLLSVKVPIFEQRNDGRDNLLGSLVIAGHYVIPEVRRCNIYTNMQATTRYKMRNLWQ